MTYYDEDEMEKYLLGRARISEESRDAIIDTLDLIIAYIDNFNGEPGFTAHSVLKYCSDLQSKIDEV